MRLAIAAFVSVAVACAAGRPSAPAAVVAAPTQSAKHWVCPACNGSCDTAVYDHPGACPHCGMSLVEQGSAEAQAHAGKPVAILLFDGAEIIDFTGPWEVFGAAGFEVYTVAASKQPLRTSMGMTVVPDFTFGNAPQPAVLLVPGGAVNEAQRDPATVRWVLDTSHRAERTLSVCNGAFILASAGLLDGLSATTTNGNLAKLERDFPRVTVVRERRWVDNGAIITAGGLSAGIDGALHVVDRMLGRDVAHSTAVGIEYDWRPDGGFAVH